VAGGEETAVDSGSRKIGKKTRLLNNPIMVKTAAGCIVNNIQPATARPTIDIIGNKEKEGTIWSHVNL
jgi:hypothetical protein